MIACIYWDIRIYKNKHKGEVFMKSHQYGQGDINQKLITAGDMKQ